MRSRRVVEAVHPPALARAGRTARGTLALLLLASCAPATAPVPLAAGDLRRAATAGETVVLARFHRADTGAGIFVGGVTSSVPAVIRRIEDGREARFGTTTVSPAAGEAGWVAQPLGAGTWYLELGVGSPQRQGRAFTFTVPPGAGVTYIGSFPFTCPYSVARPCQVLAPPVAEPPGARPALPEVAGEQHTRLATRFSREAALRGWPAPARIEAGIDSIAVQAAVNWEDFVGSQGSRGTFRVAGGIAEIGASAGQAGQAGVLIALPFFAVALGTVAVGGVVAGAEAIHRSQVAHEWQPCLDALGDQVAPARLERRMTEALAMSPEPAAPGRGAAAAVWQAKITRVVLRRCAEAGRYGVEVASRWTAPGHEARFLRQVPRAPAMPGLTWATVAPWESVVGGDAPCRPLAEYCRPESGALVARDVTEAMVAARGALLAAP